MIFTTAAFHRIGRTLWGLGWRAELAKRLGITPSAVHAWGSGHKAIEPELRRLMLTFVDEQIEALRKIKSDFTLQ